MMHIKIEPSYQKKILLKCLIATLGIHVAAFLYFYKFPPGLPEPWHKMFVNALPILKMIPKEEESSLLEEVFEPFSQITTGLVQPYDMLISNEESSTSPKRESVLPFSLSTVSALVPEEETQTLSFSFSLDLDQKEDASLALPETLNVPVPYIHYDLSEGISTAAFVPEIELEEPLGINVSNASPQELSFETKKDTLSIPQVKTAPSLTMNQETYLSEALPPRLSLIEEKITPPSSVRNLTPPIASAESYHLPKPKTIEISGETLEAEIRIGKAPQNKGHLFTITLKPTKNAKIKTMQQNYTFLIDRSNSIEKYHFASFKKATLRALSMLQPEDTFNIIVFDKKAVHFRKKPMYYSKEALEEAENFLNKQQHGGLFAAADLYEILPKILPTNVSQDEVNTVILLTDGTSDAKPRKQEAAIQKLLSASKKKMTLYTAAVGKDNNLKLLELVSSCTGGSLLYSDTFAAFPRRLAGLVYRLRAPLAKEITVSILSHQPGQRLFSPPSSVFHTGQPYEIVGITNNLEEFTLLIEGEHEGEAVRMKKKINFAQAKKDNAYVSKKWSAVESRLKYEKQLAKNHENSRR